MIELIVIIVNLVLSYLLANEGEKREIGFRRSLIFSLLFGAIIGGIITLLSPRLTNKEKKNERL